MLCSISGEVPAEPVVSKKSGALFEKRLALKYIADNGTDPTTGEPMTADDLLELKTSPAARPRPPTATSIPALLTSLQSEWDAAMLEVFELRKQYKQVRQELTAALYHNDAAARVVARLTRERDEARAALANVQQTLGAAMPAAGDGMDVDKVAPRAAEGIPEDVLEKMTEVSTSLSKVRRKRKAPATLCPAETVGSFSQKREISSLHSTTNPGVLAMAMLAPRSMAATCGKDGTVALLDLASAKVIAEMSKAHSGKKVLCAAWQRQAEDTNLLLTGGADKVVRCWEAGDSGATAKWAAKNVHNGDVEGVTVHASGDYFISAGADGVWAFGMVEDGRIVQKVAHDEVKGYSSVQFHPDGIILGTGTSDGKLRLWDVKAQSNVATLENHKGKISSIAFSENGYMVATAAEGEGVVRLWDLRKLDQSATIETGESKVASVAFDYSGQYLAVAAGPNIGVYPNKTWSPATLEIASAHDGKDVTCVAFGTDARYLASAGMDRTVRIYSE